MHKVYVTAKKAFKSQKYLELLLIYIVDNIKAVIAFIFSIQFVGKTNEHYVRIVKNNMRLINISFMSVQLCGCLCNLNNVSIGSTMLFLAMAICITGFISESSFIAIARCVVVYLMLIPFCMNPFAFMFEKLFCFCTCSFLNLHNEFAQCLQYIYIHTNIPSKQPSGDKMFRNTFKTNDV